MGEARVSLFFSSRAAALVSRVSRLRRSRARALPLLNLKKKRDCSQSRLSGMYEAGEVRHDTIIPFEELAAGFSIHYTTT